MSVLEGDDLAQWQGAFAGHAKDHRYYQIAAETLAAQFDHRYLFLTNTVTGEVAMQQIFSVRQDLIDPIFRIALRYLQPVLHDPIIRKFPNAHDL